MLGGPLGGKILGGGGGGGRLLKSISVPVPVFGLVVGVGVSPGEGVGAIVGVGADRGLEERGCEGLEETVGVDDGPAKGPGNLDPGKMGKEFGRGGGTLFPEEVICCGEGMLGLVLVMDAGS